MPIGPVQPQHAEQRDDVMTMIAARHAVGSLNRGMSQRGQRLGSIVAQ